VSAVPGGDVASPSVNLHFHSFGGTTPGA